ncbi:MAG: hypothetical protein ACI8W8_004461, partial [Rhodothermales bacterium]
SHIDLRQGGYGATRAGGLAVAGGAAMNSLAFASALAVPRVVKIFVRTFREGKSA